MSGPFPGMRFADAGAQRAIGKSVAMSADVAVAPPPAGAPLEGGGGGSPTAVEAASELPPPTRAELEAWIRELRVAEQARVVTVRSGMSVSAPIYLSARRWTMSDVISVVTTTAPVDATAVPHAPR